MISVCGSQLLHKSLKENPSIMGSIDRIFFFFFTTLISAFVLSWIDYCNSLLAGCPKQLIHKLQKVQDNAASLLCRTPKSDHISPVLHTLHWLPAEQRIEYKLLLIAFKSVKKGKSCGRRKFSYQASVLTPSFQLYICFHICSKDASFPVPITLSDW